MAARLRHREIVDGRAVLDREAAPEIAARCDRMEAAGEGRWVLDPHVPLVVAFIATPSERPLVIVYVQDGDFECADEMLP